jgi:hypothetical protein
MRVESLDEKQRPAALIFGLGTLVGFLAAALFVVGAAKSVQQRGVRVRVELAPIAAQVETEVKAAVQREVPATLAAMKNDLPKRVAEQTAQRLSQTTINIGGFNVPVPPAATAQVQSGVEQALRAGLNMALTDQDINALSDRLSTQAGSLVQQQLKMYLTNRSFPVDLWPGFSIPVTVIPE